MAVLKIKPTPNGEGKGGGALYKHTVTLTCLDTCSSTRDIIVIFNSSKQNVYTEEEFKELFSIYHSATHTYLLDIVNVVIVPAFTSLVDANVLTYSKENDYFQVRSETFTLQSFEDVVSTI